MVSGKQKPPTHLNFPMVMVSGKAFFGGYHDVLILETIHFTDQNGFDVVDGHACYVQQWLMYCASGGHQKKQTEQTECTFGGLNRNVRLYCEGFGFSFISYLAIFHTRGAMVESTT